jgi:hypothetical protein
MKRPGDLAVHGRMNPSGMTMSAPSLPLSSCGHGNRRRPPEALSSQGGSSATPKCGKDSLSSPWPASFRVLVGGQTRNTLSRRRFFYSGLRCRVSGEPSTAHSRRAAPSDLLFQLMKHSLRHLPDEPKMKGQRISRADSSARRCSGILCR